MKFNNDLLKDLPDRERYTYLSTTSNRFFGLRMQQIPEALLKINQLLNHVYFARIVEIGAGDGGLSYLFGLHCKINKLEFHSYDIHDKGANIKELREVTDGFEVKDVLFNEENIKELASIIQKPGRTLCIMDAGKKIDFAVHAKHLKVGDCVMLHDFAPDEKYFEEKIRGKVWNWLECTYADIEEEANKNNIVFTDYFNDCVWAFGYKEV